jgi:hypothetical protein
MNLKTKEVQTQCLNLQLNKISDTCSTLIQFSLLPFIYPTLFLTFFFCHFIGNHKHNRYNTASFFFFLSRNLHKQGYFQFIFSEIKFSYRLSFVKYLSLSVFEKRSLSRDNNGKILQKCDTFQICLKHPHHNHN